jgi:glycosyltransferase involved in cell wall biosynthesis
MLGNPLISIIIPVYNRETLISETIRSIQEQTYTHWECIIVDDGSSDETLAVVSAFAKADSRIILYKRPETMPKGANACRNYGYKKSKGDYVNWFDSDDLMVVDKLQKQLQVIQNTNTLFNVCQTMVFDDITKKELGFRCEHIISEDFFNDFISDKIKWLTQAPLINSSFIKANNITFDESLHRSQERDFFIKILAIIDDYSSIDEPLVYLRKHNDSISYGLQSDKKYISTFNVNYNTYKDFSNRLNEHTKKYLVTLMKHSLREQIVGRNFKLVKRFYNDLLNSGAPITMRYKLRVQLARCSYFLFNKGYFLLKD